MMKKLQYFLLTCCVATNVLTQPLPPQLCSQIKQFDACTTATRQRVDGCSRNVSSVPNLAFYDCQCKELTSIQTCYTYCSDSPDIQRQLPNEQDNAKAWCDQASSMRAAQPTTTNLKETSVTTSSLKNLDNQIEITATTITTTIMKTLPVTGESTQVAATATIQSTQINNQFSTNPTNNPTLTKSYGPAGTLDFANNAADIKFNDRKWYSFMMICLNVILLGHI
jgi:hypothetical protein